MAHNERFEELVAQRALGLALPAEESGELAVHLEGCETCEVLLADLRETAAALSVAAAPVAPRPELRRRILASLMEAAAVPARRPPVAPWLFAAAAALLVAIVGLDDARLRREREDLRSRTADLSGRLSSAEQDLARRELRARVMESDDVRLLFLGGKAPQPEARGKVFWSQKARRGVLVAGNLSALPAGKQYELWVFAKGKPVPAGVFDVDISGRAIFESPNLSKIAAAENFAVTVEPQGGVPAPTGPIVLVGSPS
ncbi:MAG: anti-sigma factor [Acidobacteriota bacterium]